MKKFLKILAIVFILLIGFIIAIPFIFRGKIIETIKTQANENLNASLNFSDVNLTLLSTFPDLSLSVKSLSITGKKEFEGDTLLYADDLTVDLGLWSVVKGSNIAINGISLTRPFINIKVLPDGKANYNITKEDSSAAPIAESEGYNLKIQSYDITEGRIVYDDQSLTFKMMLDQVFHQGKGDFTKDLFVLSTKSTIEKSSVWYGGIKYLSNAKALLDADLDMDMKNFKFTFKENTLTINDLPIHADGWLAMPGNDMDMDIKWRVNKSEFKSFMSLVPGVYSSSFKDVTASGKLAMNGFVKGRYNDHQMPGYSLNLNIANGNFKYPGLPQSINNMMVDLKINNRDGVTDHTIIDLKKMHLEMAGNPMDARLFVTNPVSNANIDGALKGKINLSSIKNMIPLESGTTLSGLIVADVSAKGNYASIEKKKYEEFDAIGTIQINDFNYDDKATNTTAFIKTMTMLFNPKNITLTNVIAGSKKTTVQANGSIDNLLGYYLKDELLHGKFNIASDYINLNEWMSNTSSTEQTNDTTSLGVIEIPRNLDITLVSDIKKLLYDQHNITNVKGTVLLQNGKAILENVAMNMMDGTLKMNGSYDSQNLKKPAVAMKMEIIDWDILQTSKAFITIKKIAPIMEKCLGKFSTTLDATGNLDQYLMPDLTTLSAYGLLRSKNVKVTNVDALTNIANQLKMEAYNSLSLANLNLSFDVANGRVSVKPFETSIAGTMAKIQGSSGIDQSIDYVMNLAIPLSKMGASAQATAQGALAKLTGSTGINIKLPDPVPVDVFIKGSLTKPIVTTNFKSTGKTVIESVKTEIKDKVNDQVDDGKAKARAEADKILADAEVKVKTMRDAGYAAAEAARKQGYAAADKLVTEAKNPLAQIAAKKAAAELKKETDKKVQKMKDETDAKCNDILSKAKAQADALLK